jgi:hypothetical protein
MNLPAVDKSSKASLQAAGMALTYSIVAESLGIVVDDPVIENIFCKVVYFISCQVIIV